MSSAVVPDAENPTLEVELLLCPACGSPVPLGEAERSRCRHCSNEIEIPEAYRDLREANRRRGPAEQEARAAFRMLGRGPSWLARLAAIIPWYASLAFAAIPAIGATVTLYFETFAAAGDLSRLVLSIGIPTLGLVLLMVLGSIGEQRTISLGGIQAAMAARPPARPGGPASCRRCGAPLEIGPDEPGGRCLYCGADNLTRVAPAWAARMSRHTTRIDHAIEDTCRRYRQQRRITAWRASYRSALIVVPVVGLTAWGYSLKAPDWLPDPERTRKERMFLRYDGKRDDTAVMTQVSGRGCNPALHERRFRAVHCNRSGCGVFYYLALRRGDSAIAGVDAAAGARLQIRRRGTSERRHLEIEAGKAIITADQDGWYEVEIDVPGAETDDHFGLCFELP